MRFSLWQAGRVRNAHYAMMNAKLPIAMDMDIALVVNVNVSEAIKELCAKKVGLTHNFVVPSLLNPSLQ